MTTVYTAGYIIVGCTIDDWTPPNNPTNEETNYTVFDPNFYITLAPKFDQTPPCAYTANMKFTWSIPEFAPIYKTSDPYQLLVTTTNVDKAGIYTVFMKNEITYGEQAWSKTISYDITVVNPCENTELFYANTTMPNITYVVGE